LVPIEVYSGIKWFSLLLGGEIIFEEFQSMWSRYLIVTDGRTDRRMTCNFITALCIASCG